MFQVIFEFLFIYKFNILLWHLCAFACFIEGFIVIVIVTTYSAIHLLSCIVFELSHIGCALPGMFVMTDVVPGVEGPVIYIGVAEKVESFTVF